MTDADDADVMLVTVDPARRCWTCAHWVRAWPTGVGLCRYRRDHGIVREGKQHLTGQNEICGRWTAATERVP